MDNTDPATKEIRINEGDNKPSMNRERGETGWCAYCNETYTIEHQFCGERH